MLELSFEEILKRLEKVELTSFDLVVGIGHSGVVPAALIAAKIKCDLRICYFEYRDINNEVIYAEPRLKHEFSLPSNIKSILVVDDASVSGKTLDAARKLFGGLEVKTLVFKGKADYVVCPEVKTCIKWPWKEI